MTMPEQQEMPWNMSQPPNSASGVSVDRNMIRGGHQEYSSNIDGSGMVTASTKVGIYSLHERRARVARFLEKREKRVWTRKIKYDVRKNFADSRIRSKGRFVKKKDEAELVIVTTAQVAKSQDITPAHQK